MRIGTYCEETCFDFLVAGDSSVCDWVLGISEQ